MRILYAKVQHIKARGFFQPLVHWSCVTNKFK